MTQNKLMALFNIHTGEGKPVLVLMGLGFLVAFAYSIARSTVYALFLAEFDAGTLPYAYIGIAILATIISTVYLKLTVRYVLGRMLLGNFAFITLLLLGLWLGATVTQARWVAFSMPVVFGILNTLGSTAYWGLIGRLLNLQQSKRLTGLLDTGGTIAFMIGGFAMPLLVLWVDAVNVLLVSAVTMALSWGVLLYINHFFAEPLNIPPEKSDETQEEAKPAESVFKSGYIRLIFSLFTLPASLASLRQGLGSPHGGVVLHSLDLLEAADPESLPTFLPALFKHPTAEVRLNVLSHIERLGLNEALPIIKERLRSEDFGRGARGFFIDK